MMEQAIPLSKSSQKRLPYLVAVAFFMQTLDATIVNTALPSIALSLKTDPLGLHSVVISYMVTVAILIPCSGWISDRLGSRRTFICSIAVFCLGSLCCALSVNVTLLIISRILQGVGASFLMPIGRLTILRSYPRDMFVQVMNLVTIPGLIGPLLGPTLGGFLAQQFSWHWIFLINIPIGLVGIVAALRWMPNLFGVESTRFDQLGYVLFAAAAVCFSLSLDTGTGQRVPTTQMLIYGVAGAVLLVSYWYYARGKTSALFNLRLFKVKHFTIGIIGNLVSRLGTGALPYMIPLFYQVVLGYSAFRAGMFMIPLATASILVKFAMPPMLGRFGYRQIMIYNTIIIGLMMAAFAFVSRNTNEWLMLGLLACLGGANSIQFTCMSTLALIDVAPRDASSGNSLLTVVMQLSISMGVGIAALTIDLLSPTQAQATLPQLQNIFHITFVIVGCFVVLSSFVFTRIDPFKGKILTQKPKAANVS